MQKGQLFVLSAPSGAGKTTIALRVRTLHPELRESVSFTTRPPRPGEVNGIDYHFVSNEEFDRLAEEDFFVEWIEIYGNRYGTGREELAEQMADGSDVLLNVDTNGGQKIKALFPEAHMIFILPPSMEDLKQRLARRGTDDPETVERRLHDAQQEFAGLNGYDFAVVNDDIHQAVAGVSAIIQAMRRRRVIIWEEVKHRFPLAE